MRKEYDGTWETSDLLVVGVGGTLEPKAGTEVLRADERLAGEELPPLLEELLAPWLKRALQELDELRKGVPAECGAERVPLDSLLSTLKLHLAEQMAQAAGEWLSSVKADSAEFLLVYPTLRPVIAGSVRNWAAGTALFLARLTKDQELLAHCMGRSALPAVVSVTATASDLHPGGAIALRVGFAGGGWVYYKPRAVTGEGLWRAMLETIAALDDGIQLPAGRVAQQEGYGWMESLVEGEAWPDRPEIQAARLSYWESAGVLLCLAQHVGLTDLHLANIWATTHGPAVIDAECLGTATSQSPTSRGFSGALKALDDTGLLPPSSKRLDVDTSGLFGQPGPISRIQVSRWVVSRTGAWRFASFPAALTRHGNSHVSARAVRPRAVAAELCAGYRTGAELLMRGRASLLSSGSIWRYTLETFHAPRCVLRETVFYAKLLSRSLTPEQLAGDEHTRRHGILAALLAGSPDVPRRVLQREAWTVAAGSIPRFVIGPGSRMLSDGEGERLWRNYSPCTPAAAVMQEMQALTKSRLEQTLLPPSCYALVNIALLSYSQI